LALLSGYVYVRGGGEGKAAVRVLSWTWDRVGLRLATSRCAASPIVDAFDRVE